MVLQRMTWNPGGLPSQAYFTVDDLNGLPYPIYADPWVFELFSNQYMKGSVMSSQVVLGTTCRRPQLLAPISYHYCHRLFLSTSYNFKQ